MTDTTRGVACESSWPTSSRCTTPPSLVSCRHFWLFAGSRTLSRAYHLAGPLRLPDGWRWQSRNRDSRWDPMIPTSKSQIVHIQLIRHPALVLSLVEETLLCFTPLRCDTSITLCSLSILSKPKDGSTDTKVDVLGKLVQEKPSLAHTLSSRLHLPSKEMAPN